MSEWLGAAWPPELAWILILALLVSSPGFYRVVYFISTGYAFSVVAIALALAVAFVDHLQVATALHAAALVVYGLRLGLFLVRRELKPSYKQELAEIHERSGTVPLGVKASIWGTVALLYVLMVSPLAFELQQARAEGPLSQLALVPGLAIMAFGLALEAWADHAKSAYKADHPDRFCDVGVYRWVRCPNYLGETIFWIGNMVTGLSTFGHGLQWASAAVGTVSIVLIMVGSTRRLELKQDERYGEREDYQGYVREVPVLWPWVPVYSLKKARIYLG